MPEMLEVEIYRKAAAATLGRRIVAVDASDAWFLKGGADQDSVVAALVGRSFVSDRRRGKLLLLDTSDEGPTLGLRLAGCRRVAGCTGVRPRRPTDILAMSRPLLHQGDLVLRLELLH
jgi:formamidopyrimidine-DNA glycosylase